MGKHWPCTDDPGSFPGITEHCRVSPPAPRKSCYVSTVLWMARPWLGISRVANSAKGGHRATRMFPAPLRHRTPVSCPAVGARLPALQLSARCGWQGPTQPSSRRGRCRHLGERGDGVGALSPFEPLFSSGVGAPPPSSLPASSRLCCKEPSVQSSHDRDCESPARSPALMAGPTGCLQEADLEGGAFPLPRPRYLRGRRPPQGGPDVLNLERCPHPKHQAPLRSVTGQRSASSSGSLVRFLSQRRACVRVADSHGSANGDASEPRACRRHTCS